MMRTEKNRIRRALGLSWLRLAILLCMGVGCQISTVAAADFSALAPEETLLYVEVRDLSQLNDAWEKTPYFRLWSDPKFTLFFGPLTKQIDAAKAKSETATGFKYDELRRTFPGEIALFLSDMRSTYNKSTQRLFRETNTGLIGRIAPGSEGRVRKMIEEEVLKDLPPDATRSSESFMGVKIYVTVYKERLMTPIPDRTKHKGKKKGAETQPSENALSLPDASDEASFEYHYEYAFVDNTMILLEGQRAFMKKVIANHFAAKGSEGPSGSLGSTPGFRSAFQSVEQKPDIIAYANVERLLRQAADDPSYSILQDTKGLRLNEVKALGAAVRLSPGSTEIDFTCRTSPSPQGVARLLVGGSTNDFKTLKLTPASATSYSSYQVDFSDLYRLVRELAAQKGRDGAAQFDSAIAAISQNANVDIPGMIAQMGGEVGMFSYPSKDATGAPRVSQAAMIQLRNPQGFEGNIDKILPMLSSRPQPTPGAAAPQSSVKRTDFKGFTIRTMGGGPGAPAPNSPAPSSLSFAVAKSFLIISSDPDAIKEVIRHVVGDAGSDLTRSESYRKAVAALKPGYVSVSWTDMSKWAEDLARTLQNQPMLMMMVRDYVQMSQMPSAESFAKFFGQMASGGYVSTDMYRYHGLITYPKSGGE